MDSLDLTKYIIDNDKIIEILEDLQCHKIKKHNASSIRCALPNHNNPTSVEVKIFENRLFIKAYDDEFSMKGDIYAFIMKLKDINFYNTMKYLHNLLNLKYVYSDKKSINKNIKTDLSSIFINARKTSHSRNMYDLELTVFNELSSEYIFLPHKIWLNEGILPFTFKKFNIGYDIRSQRILIPHRLWCGTENDYVGLMGRTTIPHYELLDIPKFLSMSEKEYFKTMNIYGLQENYLEIQDKGYVIVYEAEKSVLKRYSKKDGTGVALCSHEISPQQVRILTSLNVEIIISLDEGINEFDVWKVCEEFYNIRPIYYMWDKYNVILKNKDSPADLKEEYYQYLLKYKIKYDENLHKQYKKQLKEKEEKREKIK